MIRAFLPSSLKIGFSPLLFTRTRSTKLLSRPNRRTIQRMGFRGALHDSYEMEQKEVEKRSVRGQVRKKRQ
jgi:hypothetical protein